MLKGMDLAHQTWHDAQRFCGPDGVHTEWCFATEVGFKEAYKLLTEDQRFYLRTLASRELRKANHSIERETLKLEKGDRTAAARLARATKWQQLITDSIEGLR